MCLKKLRNPSDPFNPWQNYTEQHKAYETYAKRSFCHVNKNLCFYVVKKKKEIRPIRLIRGKITLINTEYVYENLCKAQLLSSKKKSMFLCVKKIRIEIRMIRLIRGKNKNRLQNKP
jgi:hypothetical protein